MKLPDRQSLRLRCRSTTRLLSFSLLLLCLLAVAPSSLSRELPEYQVKAAFLFNFAAFVSWPKSLFETADSPLRYCTLNADAISGTLDQLISGESLDGRPLELIRLENMADAKGCHILFLGSEVDYGSILQLGGNPGILTVGDTELFLERGGMITLLRKRKRIHPVINMDALDESILRLSSKLLRMASRVRPESGE